MNAMRESWTDPRLDELNVRVDAGFERCVDEFKDVRREMRAEFAAVRAEMKAEFAAVRAEMKAEFAAVRAEMKAEFAAVRAEMKAEFAAVRIEIGEVRQEINALNRTLTHAVIAMMTAMLIGFSGVIATILTRT